MAKVIMSDAMREALQGLCRAVGLDPNNVGKVSVHYDNDMMWADFKVFLTTDSAPAAAGVMDAISVQVSSDTIDST
jgi:hypothetical protein